MSPPSTATSGLVNEQAFNDTVVLDDGETMQLETHGEAPPTEKPASPKWVGKRLGRFKLLRLLGQGGMGVVIQAQDIHLGRIVALKVLRKQIKGVDDQQRVDQFLREAKSAARIEHPNAAAVYEINEHKGWWYIASELIEGGTLQKVVQAAGKLAPAQACPLIADAAAVLAAAHQAGIIHRDIKPQNLMLTRMGRCKVVDFGLVRVEDPNDPFDFTERAVGTPDYLPPEAARRGMPTSAYDIYSLAGTLYFALTGRPPFKARTLPELIKLHAEAPRPDVRELNPACSERLAQLIQHGMAVDPAQRPPAEEFAAVLRVESIGGDSDPAALVHKVLKAQTAEPAGGGSGLSMLPLSGTDTHGSKVLSSGDASGAMKRPGRRPWATRFALPAVVLCALVAVGVMVLLWARTPPTVGTRADFERLFPDAPAGYGERKPGDASPSTQRLSAPPFSWVGQADPQDNAYVASSSGRLAYPIDHPAAMLIPADAARFYRTAEEAASAGKTVISD